MGIEKSAFALIAKNGNPSDLIKGRGVDLIIEMYFQIMNLKQLYRRGWLRKERVSKMHCESVADHCFGMLVLAWLIMDKFTLGLDMTKVFKMIIAHEFGEVYGGDITPVDGISDKDKYSIEKASVLKLFGDFPSGIEYILTWEEYTANISKEAKFVSQIDKLEMAFQASIYQLQHAEEDFSSFIASADEEIYDAKLKELLEQIKLI